MSRWVDPRPVYVRRALDVLSNRPEGESPEDSVKREKALSMVKAHCEGEIQKAVDRRAADKIKNYIYWQLLWPCQLMRDRRPEQVARDALARLQDRIEVLIKEYRRVHPLPPE